MAKCKTKYCRNEAKRSGICYKCERKNTVSANPYRYAYQTLKDNAKRRRKPFALTFEYWVKWCDDTGYLSIKGRCKDEASVDCIVNDLGYVDGNIRPLTVGDNASKGIKKVSFNTYTKQFEILTLPPIQQVGEQYF